MAHPNPDYVTFDHTTPDGVDVVVVASYSTGVPPIVEITEAVDPWGEDHLHRLSPHEYEHLRLTALSLFHEREV